MPKIIKLSNGVEGVFVKNSRFNTTKVNFSFYLPFCRENYAANALLPYVLTTCSEEYKDFRSLNLELGRLYGATVTTGNFKFMDYQCFDISISVINDRYSIDGEKIVSRATELLASLIFAPSLDGESFCQCDLEREKRQMLERIDGEINDKRSYAKMRATSLMFPEDVYGLPVYGTREEMEKVTGRDLFAAWENMLRTAYIRVTVIGEELPVGVFDGISAAFSAIDRKNAVVFSGYKTPVLADARDYTERMNITQGKLVMAFSLGKAGNQTDTAAQWIMADIFGGGTYSKLFSDVREKQSLCYYCACRSVRNKGIMTVESGVEAQNAEKAQAEILRQLEKIKNGEVTKTELSSSKKSLTDAIKSIDDSQEAISIWYTNHLFDESVSEPMDVIESISAVTLDDVIKAAQLTKQSISFKLLPLED